MFEIEHVYDYDSDYYDSDPYYDSEDEDNFFSCLKPMHIVNNPLDLVRPAQADLSMVGIYKLKTQYGVDASEYTGIRRAEQTVSKLIDLAATAVGKYHEPSDIIRCVPPHDELLYQKVLSTVAPQTMNSIVFLKNACNIETAHIDVHEQACGILFRHEVISVIQVGFLLIARFKNIINTSRRGEITVSIKFAKQEITSVHCDMCTNNLGCKHSYAAVLFRIYLSSLVQIYPPLTDTLSAMKKCDLQRLLLLLLSEESPSLIHKCQQHIITMKTPKRTNDENDMSHDPSLSSTGTQLQLYKNVVNGYIPRLKQTFNLNYFKDFDQNNRDMTKEYLREATHLCRYISYPQDPLPLMYITTIGGLARTTHERYYDGDDESLEDCILSSFNFLIDFMTSAACVFPQRHNRVCIDTIDIQAWKQALETCCVFFKVNNKPAMIDDYDKVKPQTLKYEPKLRMPRIYPLYKEQIQKVFDIHPMFDLQDNYLSEVIASLFVPPPPEEYIQLVSSNTAALSAYNFPAVPPIKSTYKEPLAVMMLRANAYDCAEFTEEMSEEIAIEKLRIMDKIIIELGKNAIKYSILSIYCNSPLLDDLPRKEYEEPGDTAFVTFVRDFVRANNTNSTDKKDDKKVVDSDINLTEKTKSNTLPATSASAHCTRTSLRKRKCVDSTNGTSSLNKHQKRKSKLKENNMLDTDEEGDNTSTSSISDINDANINCTPEQLPTGSVDDNLTRERLCYYLLYWLGERQNLFNDSTDGGYFYYGHRDLTEPIIEGIKWLTLELSRFRLTKDAYTKKEHEHLWKFERNLFSCMTIWLGDGSCDFYDQINWWLYISAWDQLGFGHYGEHFPTAVGSCVFAREISKKYIDFEYFGYDVKRYQRVFCQFATQELKVTYKTTAIFDKNMAPQSLAYRNLFLLYLKVDEGGKGDGCIQLCENVVDACLHSNEKTKIKHMYDTLSDLSNSPQCVEYFVKKDGRGNKLKLRIASQLGSV